MIIEQRGNLVWSTYTDEHISEKEQGFSIYLEKDGRKQYLDICASESARVAYDSMRRIWRSYIHHPPHPIN